MPMLQKLCHRFSRGSRPRRLRAHLVALFLIAMAPLFVFAVYMIYRSSVEEQLTFQRGAIARVRAIMTAVDTEIKSSTKTLEALATSKELDGDDLRAFYEEALRAFKSQSDWSTINVADRTGRRLIDVRRPVGAELPPLAEPEMLKQVFETQRMVVGNLVLGPVTGDLDFAIRVPVVRDGQTKYVLSGVVKPSVIGALLAKQQLPDGWVLMVLDLNNRIIARTLAPETSLGQFAAPDLPKALAESTEGWHRGRSLEGEEVYRAHTRSPYSGWTVALNIPTAVVEAPLWNSLAYTALPGLGLVILGLTLALLFSRRTTQSIEALSELAGELAAGRSGEPVAVPAHVAEVAALRDAFLSARRQIEERANERDAFERELWQQASLLELTHDAIFVFEFPQRGIVYWNRGAEMLYGYSKTEAIGKSPRELLKTYHPRGTDFIAAALEENGQWSGELVHIASDGREVFLDSRQVLVAPAEGPRLVLETNRDATERRREERRREGRAAVTAIIAEAHALADAAPRIAEALGTLGGWDMCNIWQWDRTAGEFVCIEVWHPQGVEVGALEIVTRGRRSKLPMRQGLLGRVLQSGEPTWIADVAADAGYYRRAEAARESGLHAAFCFPIKIRTEVLGFVECYSREVRTPDPDFVRTLAAIGLQLGHFFERTRVEEAVEWLSRLPAENPAPVLRLAEGRVVAFANPSAMPLLERWRTGIGGQAPQYIAQIARAALSERQKRTVELDLAGTRYNVTVAPVPEANYVNLYFAEIPERKTGEAPIPGGKLN